MGRLRIPPLSEAFVRRVAEVSRRELGLDHLDASRLAAGVAQVSRRYTLERAELEELQRDARALSARLQFFLPRDLLKMHGPLSELACVGGLPNTPRGRVLDLGAGLGATSLGAARFAALSGSTSALDLLAVDVDPEALELFEALAADLHTLPAVPVTLKTQVADLASFCATGPFDLIVLGLVLNEHAVIEDDDDSVNALAERVLNLAKLLDEDGALIILEPALRETSRVLHAVRDQLAARAARPFVFAPCVRAGACPMLARARDYCHERLPCDLPASLAQVANAAGLRERDLTYSYLTLTNKPRSLRELGPEQQPLFRAVSGQLKTKGKTEVWLCGDNGTPRAQRLDRQRTESNADLELAERGCIVRVSSPAAAASGALLRIDKSAEIQVLQRWERASFEAEEPHA